MIPIEKPRPLARIYQYELQCPRCGSFTRNTYGPDDVCLDCHYEIEDELWAFNNPDMEAGQGR